MICRVSKIKNGETDFEVFLNTTTFRAYLVNGTSSTFTVSDTVRVNDFLNGFYVEKAEVAFDSLVRQKRIIRDDNGMKVCLDKIVKYEAVCEEEKKAIVTITKSFWGSTFKVKYP